MTRAHTRVVNGRRVPVKGYAGAAAVGYLVGRGRNAPTLRQRAFRVFAGFAGGGVFLTADSPALAFGSICTGIFLAIFGRR